MSQNRDAEAINILGKYHANGNPSDPLVVLEYQEIREAMILEKEIAGETSYLTLFKSAGNLKRMRIIIALGFFSQWSGNGLFSYYLNEIFQVSGCVTEKGVEGVDNKFQTLGITSPGMKTLLNGVLQIWNLIMALGAALLVDRLGRRTLFVSNKSEIIHCLPDQQCVFRWYQTQACYAVCDFTC